MTHELKQRELIIDLATGEFQVWPITDPRIIGPADYAWVRYREALAAAGGRPSSVNVMTWGGGPLAGSRIPGSRRLVFGGYSPSWEGFYLSSLGGGAYVMHRIGADFVCIRGQAPEDSVLILNHKRGQISVRLEPIDPDNLWIGYAPAEPDPADPHGDFLIGFYALQQAVFDRYKAEYEGDWVRVFAVGPGARHTNEGVIGSNQVRKGRILPIDDWAGRGGLGSRLLQYHRIAACIFGGDWEDPDLKDSKEIDGYFMANYGQPMIKVDLGATEKYRYVPGFQTGGTFGVNYHTVGDRLLSFNYASALQPSEVRQAQSDAFIRDHYLRQFNEEIIQPKNYAHCGEPCGVVCKKYDRVYKKDYEPYQALGPQCGVFDQRAAEELNHFVDAMALDAIQAGCTLSWIMECLRDGLFPAEDFGFPPVDEMRFGFTADPAAFDLVMDSRRNADYAYQVLFQVLFDPRCELFRGGIRAAARALDDRYGLTDYGKRTTDRAVYTAHGESGCMVPNQYWVPGMFAPMPMMGKYFVYYGLDFLPPRELGRKCVERMVYELFNENSGICRFHRKWAEVIADEIISAHYNFPVDYKAHQFALAKQIYEHDGAAVAPWEGERTVDLIWAYLEETGRDSDYHDPELRAWVERFRADKWAAARAYWEELRAGIAEAFAAGAEAIPDQVAPGPAARVDVMGKK
ncbi:MAG: aldehyde ferredoxin oxidoreductase [Anaerolineae bacterium]|nr:aldehyde ferredoxin oxidoreductase [Anaerolineae bacterium]